MAPYMADHGSNKDCPDEEVISKLLDDLHEIELND